MTSAAKESRGARSTLCIFSAINRILKSRSDFVTITTHSYVTLSEQYTDLLNPPLMTTRLGKLYRDGREICKIESKGGITYAENLRTMKLTPLNNDQNTHEDSVICSPVSVSAKNRLITSKDHASVQINVGHLGPNGVFTVMFAILAEIFAAPPLPSWLIEDDINYYAANFEETGFIGGFDIQHNLLQ
ncbi:hypothetical protein CASFOL_009373 [Castilleja foliolosa]|uniref:Uncharacterized protein n=1 Tax=Castilleja foliolosa TaxID=1961234 RepID=A0ABD3DY72_9LAMI